MTSVYLSLRVLENASSSPIPSSFPSFLKVVQYTLISSPFLGYLSIQVPNPDSSARDRDSWLSSEATSCVRETTLSLVSPLLSLSAELER